MFRRVAGRPVLPRMDRAAQRRRTMSRCQRTIVSGVTSSRSPWRRAFGITPSRAASRARSAQFSFGRRGCRRCRTASWWRRIKISAVFHASSRRDSRSHAATRVIRRNTNRRHMIGDHHGRSGRESNSAGQSRGRDSRHAQYPLVDVVKAAIAPGSVVVISHATTDDLSPDAVKQVQELYAQATAPAVPRSREEIARFFDGLELVRPGIVDAACWRAARCQHDPAGRSFLAVWPGSGKRRGPGVQVAR